MGAGVADLDWVFNGLSLLLIELCVVRNVVIY